MAAPKPVAKRPPKQAGYSWLSPYFVVKDAAAAADFYERAFGLKKKFMMPLPDGRAGHTEMTWHDIVVMFGPEQPEHPCKTPTTLGVQSPVQLYLYCEDVDALYARATAAGARGEQAPETMFYGDRVCRVVDPDGYAWGFATNVADFDPAKMPAKK
jgi:uncharacterized glyoxalase superfamily protein PhnB